MRTAVAILLLAGTAIAHWGDWTAGRETGPHGRYYVVLRYHEATKGVRYSLARIGDDAPPVERAEYGSWKEFGDWSIERGVRDGDRILSTGGLPHPPHTVLVSATGLGFVGVGDEMENGVEKPLTLVPAAGKPVRIYELADLFSHREILGFELSGSGVGYLRGAWIDDGARKVVAVASESIIRTVTWDDGKVAKGGDADILRALDLPYDDARTLALELAAERRIAGAKAGAKRILADETEPTAMRLRAAVALAAIGDMSGRDFVVLEADAGDAYAIRYLPEVLGEKAIPRLIARLAGAEESFQLGYDVRATDAAINAAAAACVRLGRAGYPALVKLLAAEKNWAAAEALVSIGDRRAVLPLLEAGFVREAVALSGDEIAPELTDLLLRGSPRLRALAHFFSRVRYPAVIPHLKAALEKAEVAKGALAKALKFQTEGKKK